MCNTKKRWCRTVICHICILLSNTHKTMIYKNIHIAASNVREFGGSEILLLDIPVTYILCICWHNILNLFSCGRTKFHNDVNKLTTSIKSQSIGSPRPITTDRPVRLKRTVAKTANNNNIPWLSPSIKEG